MKIAVFLGIIGLSHTLCAQTSTQAQSKPISVCELLDARHKYHRQVVNVTGEFVETSEGQWLVGFQCKGILVINRRHWDHALWLTSPYNSDVVGTYPPVNHANLKKLANVLGPSRGSTKRRLLITYRGVFETKPDRELNMADGHPVGYGHLSDSPGRLIVLDALAWTDRRSR